MTSPERRKEDAMTETGYGRGWQEPKARTPIARVIQIAREPATTTTYVACLAFFMFVVIVTVPLLLFILSA